MSFYIYIIIAFALGGIPFGLLVGYMFGAGDIRKVGSGNIGATNVWRTAGPGAAMLVFVGDIGKGVLAVLLAGWMISASWPVAITTAGLIGGCAAVLGHMFSPFLGFRGGKGEKLSGVRILESSYALRSRVIGMRGKPSRLQGGIWHSGSGDTASDLPAAKINDCRLRPA